MTKMMSASPRAFFTTYEASKILDVSLRTVQLWTENGMLECWKTQGGHRRIPRDSLERLCVGSGDDNVIGAGSKSSLPASALPPVRLNILVVEDEPSLLRLYRLQMARWALAPAVTTAFNGFEAMVRIGSRPPDLLITDLRMPDMDGFRMLHALRSMHELDEMEIVVVSGLDPAEIAMKGGVPSDIRTLAKPIPFGELERIAGDLAKALGRQTASIGKWEASHAIAP